MFLGLDIGTSAIKAVLVDEMQQVLAQGSVSLSVSRIRDGWSEQDPQDWWRACVEVIRGLEYSSPNSLHNVQAIGLSGQMHGATLLGKYGDVLRPAILWNDSRSAAQCTTLEQRVPELGDITGNLAMPGFTAPKLLWVMEQQPELFAQIHKVLLPKDYIRYRLSGIYASDMSDAAGTLWLDVGKREWSETMLAATGLNLEQMPDLFEGSEQSAVLSSETAQLLGLNRDIPIAGGGGDNACGAVGIGAVTPGQAFISLGTSGVFFVSNAAFSPNPDQGMHAFCHALPDTWHQMGVTLSAASCLDWVVKLTGSSSVDELMREIDALVPTPSSLIFLPYLSGERTPHNDANARGVFFGMNHETTRAQLGRAVLEGVAYSFADAQEALIQGGADIGRTAVIGGGSRSRVWGEILASVLGRPLDYLADGEYGPAFGASRLARLAKTGEAVTDVCTPATVSRTQLPNEQWMQHYSGMLNRYRGLYVALKDEFTVNSKPVAPLAADT